MRAPVPICLELHSKYTVLAVAVTGIIYTSLDERGMLVDLVKVSDH